MNLTRISNIYFNNQPICNFFLSKKFTTQLINKKFKSLKIANQSESQSTSEFKLNTNRTKMTGSLNPSNFSTLILKFINFTQINIR